MGYLFHVRVCVCADAEPSRTIPGMYRITAVFIIKYNPTAAALGLIFLSLSFAIFAVFVLARLCSPACLCV